MGSVNHFLQTDDRRDGELGSRGMHNPSAIEDQGGFIRQHQAERAVEIADVNGFVICIKN